MIQYKLEVYMQIQLQSAVKMNEELNLIQMRETFKRLSISTKDTLSSQQLLSALSELSLLSFDSHVFNEIWEECHLNARGEVKLFQFLDYMIQAQSILISREKQLLLLLTKQQQAKQSSQALTQTKQLLFEIRQSIQMLHAPFRLRQTFINIINIEQNDKVINLDTKLSILLYVCTLLLILSLSISFVYNCFTNFIITIAIYGYYLFKFINRRVIKIIVIILGVSIAIDIVQYIVSNIHGIVFWINVICSVVKAIMLIIAVSQWGEEHIQRSQVEWFKNKFILKTDIGKLQLKNNIYATLLGQSN